MGRRVELAQELRERHVNMMAFSCTVGFGIFLQAGKIINFAGPGLALVCFLLACSMMWAVTACLGEMTALFPVQGPLMEFPGRFLDQSVGFACAWMAWATWVIIMAAEVLAVSQLFQFSFPQEYLDSVGYPGSISWGLTGWSPAIWVGVTIGTIGLVNLLPVKIYGELEYVFGCMKMVFIGILLMFCVVVNGAQYVSHANHFWTWYYPWGFASKGFVLQESPLNIIKGGFGHFLSLWTGITSIVFSIIGCESIAISAPENKDLTNHEIIKLATRKLSIRVSVLYILCCFCGGLNIPYDDPQLAAIQDSFLLTGANSVFVLTAVRNHLKGWPHFFNGFFIFSATSCGINGLYISSRMLHALACIDEAWPHWMRPVRQQLETTSSRGVPYLTIFISWCFGLLGFLGMRAFPSIILGRMATNAVVTDLLAYAIICLTFTVFFRKINQEAAKESLDINYAYNRDENSYPYRSHWQVYRAWYGFIFCVLLITFNGWRSFVTPFAPGDFVASYISIPIFVFIICAYHVKTDGWKVWKWKRHVTYELKRPAPKVTTEPRRRGRWPRLEKHDSVKDVASKFWTWLWTWLK